jgi:hypothetical protein
MLFIVAGKYVTLHKVLSVMEKSGFTDKTFEGKIIWALEEFSKRH